MKKSWIIILFIMIAIVGIVSGVAIYGNRKQAENNIIENTINEISEKVTDDCTEEYEEMEEEAKLDIETNTSEEKISPNCLVILKRYYKECNHLLNEYIDIPNDLVNGTQEDLQLNYPNWKIEEFSSNKITLYKEFDNSCGQHFVLRNDNGKITVYKINENDEEEVYEKTEIAVDYLTETDKITIQDGIRVNGVENLNQLLEDFE